MQQVIDSGANLKDAGITFLETYHSHFSLNWFSVATTKRTNSKGITTKLAGTENSLQLNIFDHRYLRICSSNIYVTTSKE